MGMKFTRKLRELGDCPTSGAGFSAVVNSLTPLVKAIDS